MDRSPKGKKREVKEAFGIAFTANGILVPEIFLCRRRRRLRLGRLRRLLLLVIK